MATRTSKLTRTIVEIVETDRREAVAAAEAATIAQATELAPLGYEQLYAARQCGELDALLATVPAELLRAQAVAFLVGRRAAGGEGWGWETVEDVAARFERAAGRGRAAALAAKIGAAQAARIKEAFVSSERIEEPAAPAVATVEIKGETFTEVRRTACGRLAMFSNGKSLLYERFALVLDGEVHTSTYANPRAGWEYGERWLDYRRDEEAWAAAVVEQGADEPAVEPEPVVEPTAPAVIAAAAPVSADLVEAVLRRREEEAVIERRNAPDADAARFAEERRRALSRARQAVTRAARAGRTLATQLLSGDWQVAGNGDLYTVRREGLALTCTCPHGERVRAAQETTARGEEPAALPRGICYHTEIISAVEEAADETTGARDERAVYALAA